MQINYEDYHPRSKFDYQGTKIVIDLTESNLDEKLQVHCLLVQLVKPHNGDWYYTKKKYKGKGDIIEFIGYDGFLASLIEAELTGARKSYLGNRGQILKPRKTIYDGPGGVKRNASSVLKEETQARKERLQKEGVPC